MLAIPKTRTKRWLAGAALVACIAAASATLGVPWAGAAPTPQVIELTVKKFAYAPDVVTVKKGVPVVIEITSLDRLHGFALPGYKIRADVVPGQVTRIAFTPDRAGNFGFLCDIFCGDGHENVNGVLVVED
ncbi:MAG TPA: cupredoxin domain-containing protein [Alphaproteobacteria bacterium]|nr:cupredoxin domain-containing protein [Alphaproteobacteria bacterium]